MRRILPVLLIAALAVAVIFLLSRAPAAKEEPLEPIVLPETWQEFRRTRLLEGKEAMNAFDIEHRKRIPIRQGAKGEYTDGTSTFHAWVGSGSNAAHAQFMVQAMTLAIGKNHERFSEPVPLELDGVTVFRTEGQGLINYYFARGQNVYYFGIDSPDPDGLVRRLIKEFTVSPSGSTGQGDR